MINIQNIDDNKDCATSYLSLHAINRQVGGGGYGEQEGGYSPHHIEKV